MVGLAGGCIGAGWPPGGVAGLGGLFFPILLMCSAPSVRGGACRQRSWSRRWATC